MTSYLIAASRTFSSAEVTETTTYHIRKIEEFSLFLESLLTPSFE
jgi:hypothetical protein